MPNQSCQGCRGTGIITYCWWKGKKEPPIVQHFLNCKTWTYPISLRNKTYPYKELNANIHSSFICNTPNLEIYRTINKWMDYKLVIHRTEYYPRLKKTIITIHVSIILESQNNCAAWRKPIFFKRVHTLWGLFKIIGT